MKVMYKVNGRLFESEEEARAYENLERVDLVAKINAMKGCTLPKAYKRMVSTKKSFSLIFKMSKKDIAKNAYVISRLVQEFSKAKEDMDEAIYVYKELRKRLKGM